MPLDDFQKQVLRVIRHNRSPESVLAGGTVLHRHGFRLSADQDLFHPATTDVGAIADQDIASLEAAGLSVERLRDRPGLVEAVVGSGNGRTRLQWVEAGAWNFFQPVPDAECGFRLHMADLSVNKVLAAAGRREVRDYVDLFLIHRHIMPLWHAIWAAPGKDESWSPGSLAERIARTNAWRQADVDADILSLMPLSAAEIGATVREAIDEARDLFDKLPADKAGQLFLDGTGNVLKDATMILAGQGIPLAVRNGGNWPSSPEIDHALILSMIDEFGPEGSKLHGDR